MKNKKILIWAAVGVILISGITAFAVKKKGGKQVPVFAVTDVSAYMGNDYRSIMYGIVTSEVSQDIKYDSNNIVNEVFVSNGQKVKKGDKLVSYDITAADIELQMKKLDKDGLGIEIQKLRREISELRNTKPTPPMPEIPEEPEVPEEPIEPDVPKEPVMAEAILDEHSLPYMGKGTSEDPYHYLVSQKGTITGRFLNKLAKEKQLFVIEVRQGDVSTGEIMKFYGQKMSEKDAVENDDAVYNLELSIAEKIEKEKDIPAHEILGKEEVENESWLSGKGTREHPYVFLVKDTGVVKGSFFNIMKEKEYYFRIETRNENKNDGIVVKAWEQNGKFVKDVTDSDEYSISINKKLPESTPDETKPDETNPVEANPGEGNLDEDGNLQSKTVNKKYKLVNTATVDYVMGADQGYSASDIHAQISQIESQIKDLQLNEKEAELEIKRMEKKLEELVVLSEIDGVVTILGDPNTPSKDGSPMMTVKSEDGLYVRGDLPEWRLSYVDVGTKLEGTVGSDGLSFTAEITYISKYPSGDRELYGSPNNNSMYPFMARIDNPDGIENEAYVDLRVVDDSMVSTDAIDIIKPFVRDEDGRYYVMKANEKGKLEKQYVTVTSSSPYISISDGITIDDRIAFPYGKNVKEGAPVRDASVDELYGAY